MFHFSLFSISLSIPISTRYINLKVNNMLSTANMIYYVHSFWSYLTSDGNDGVMDDFGNLHVLSDDNFAQGCYSLDVGEVPTEVLAVGWAIFYK